MIDEQHKKKWITSTLTVQNNCMSVVKITKQNVISVSLVPRYVGITLLSTNKNKPHKLFVTSPERINDPKSHLFD